MKEKIQASLLGVALGDALGMPWETMTYVEIQEFTNENGVVGFAEPVQTKIKDTRNLLVGDTTDDWQLTKIVCQSLINVGRFDKYNQAMLHIKSLKKTKLGWGKTTQSGIKNLEQLIKVKGKVAAMSKLSFSRKPGKASTGVAMKIAPIALYCVARYGGDYLQPLLKAIRHVGSLTHKDTRATTAACALGIVICECFIEPLEVGNSRREGEILTKVVRTVEKLEEVLPCDCPADELTSAKIKEALSCTFDSFASSFLTPNTFFAPTAVAVSINAFFQHPQDFKKAVLGVINVGDDTDTIGSMVGALVGANDGLKSIPKPWIRFRKEYQEAFFLGAKLYDVARG